MEKLKIKKVGRKPYILNTERFIKILNKVNTGEISNVEAYTELKMCKTNYYKFKKIYNNGGKI